MNDVHTPKWADAFRSKHEVHLFHADKFSLCGVMRLRKLIRQWKPDILHAHYAGTWGLLGALTHFHPFVVTIHGSEVLLTKEIKRKLVKYVLQCADLITSDAGHVEQVASKMAKGIKGKLRRVNFGVDVTRFAPSGSNHRDIDIISLRNHDPIYDIDTLLRAVKLLEPEFPDLKVLIAGQGPETERLKELANETCKESVHFRTLEAHEVGFWLNRSRLYVSTALSDAGIAASTAEAMACGLPVVISDVFENRNWVCPGRQLKGLCFQIYRPGDATELAEKISFMLNRPDTRKTLGQMNRKTVVQWNNYDTEMEKMEKLYQKLLTTKGDRLRL